MPTDPAQLVGQVLNGLAYASELFLVSAGLSIIFGVTRVVNFAHGSFFMLGAYIAYSCAEWLPGSALGFWGGILVAALATGILGVVMEVAVLRRIYRAPELFQVLATIGVVLVVANLTQIVWGVDSKLGPRAPGLKGVVHIMGAVFPQYDLALILFGPAVLGVLVLLFRRTRWGVLIRAATQDREMVDALGVDQAVLFTSVLFAGCFLAGLSGALELPKAAVNLQMDLSIIVEAFVVVVIGGMGSVFGAFIAALLIGELQSFGATLVPQGTEVLVFLAMAVVLVFRPYGILGKSDAAARPADAAVELPYRAAGRGAALAAAAVGAALLALPLFLGGYAQVILTEMFVWALFATSLLLLVGAGGMVSFGHAAYFALGAYGVALLVKYAAVTMGIGLVAAPLAAAFGAFVFGAILTRLSGVYLAMLTLAFAQILWSIAEQWTWATGGDNGILAIRRAAWVASDTAYYYLTLILCAAALYAIRRLVFAPFGYALRAARDSPLKCDAIGIDVRRVQWAAFVVAGAFAGLAGGLLAYHRGNVFPTEASIATSLDALVMVLLGGVQTLVGGAVGAFAYLGLETELIRYSENYWRLILGLVIIGLVILFPRGIAGFVAARFGARGE